MNLSRTAKCYRSLLVEITTLMQNCIKDVFLGAKQEVVKEFHIKPGGRALISSLLFEILEPLFISLFRNFPSGRLCWSRPSSPIHRVLHSLLQVGESINWVFLIR